MELRWARNEIRFVDPVLPDVTDELLILELRLRDTTLDLRFARHGPDVSLAVLRRSGAARATVSK